MCVCVFVCVCVVFISFIMRNSGRFLQEKPVATEWCYPSGYFLILVKSLQSIAKAKNFSLSGYSL